jgi:hypothetical protein
METNKIETKHTFWIKNKSVIELFSVKFSLCPHYINL